MVLAIAAKIISLPSGLAFGIIIQVDPDVEKYPYRIIFASDDEDDDWYSEEGVDTMVYDYMRMYFNLQDENAKDS